VLGSLLLALAASTGSVLAHAYPRTTYAAGSAVTAGRSAHKVASAARRPSWAQPLGHRVKICIRSAAAR